MPEPTGETQNPLLMTPTEKQEATDGQVASGQSTTISEMWDGELGVKQPVIPEIQSIPADFVPTTEAHRPEPLAVLPHAPNREVIPIDLTDDQKAAKLAEQTQNQRLVDAARPANSGDSEPADAEQL